MGDLIFNRWSIDESVFNATDSQSKAIFRCSCGTVKSVKKYNVVAGLSKSCGCLQIEKTSETNTTHGETVWGGKDSDEYVTWCKMRERCNSKSCKSYKNYGGRGITVCDRWNSFENFLEDMGRKPTPSHSIERVNNSLDYAPDNCIWATDKHQANNKRNNVLFTINGETLTRAQVCEKYGINYGTFRSRINRGWDVEEAINPKLRTNQHR